MKRADRLMVREITKKVIGIIDERMDGWAVTVKEDFITELREEISQELDDWRDDLLSDQSD